ncbi:MULTISPECIES: sulfate transporter CysZ [Legionella]|uniref:Putative sulfate transport protein CysZ n=1 Tax=Legionella maceachernii TaxID=466 RepID=A0A0W0W0T6_9GAMM|nr:sulfate transporter CysZ [Legionella maceachernii]KTD25919.1 putative sulfate transport protein CysZ [Legionella maceachernii]SJZ48458.1 CysZ protein [Legionella maceachernii]SUP03837.1 putative sulfate transport protein CysZ [Legionella maceachernii]
MRQFFRGMYYFVLGIRHLTAKGLKRFILLPILFNCLLFVGIIYFTYDYLFSYSHYYISLLPAWLSFLNWLFLIFFVISFFLLFFVTFTVFFNLVASPFNGLLAEKAQRLFYQRDIPSVPFKQTILRSIKRQGQFLWYFFPRFIGMVFLFFIPIIHPIYPLLWFLFNSWILSIQYQDFVMDNNLIGFKKMRNKIQDNAMLSLGFGSCISLASFIPFVNLVILTAAVIGSVFLYNEEYQTTLNHHPRLLKE